MMAYDAARHRLTLYGGQIFAANSSMGDTWEWDGSAWSQRAAAGPIQAAYPALAYDAARQRTVLFGGLLPTGPQWSSYGVDTWEWNGVTWTKRASTGPPGRYASSAAYDSARQRTVLFGGISNTVPLIVGDTWEWDGAAWSQRSSTGASARSGHAMAYDSARHKAVLFGGRDASNAWLADTWEWDGTAWTQNPAAGPSVRSGHAMAYDASRQRTVLFSGADPSGKLGDTWEFDGLAWSQRSTTGPAPRTGHSMVFDTVRQRVLLFGGTGTSGALGDSWEWNGSVWTQTSAVDLPPRTAHAMVYDSARQATVLFGGAGALGIYNGDTWESQSLPCAATTQMCCSGSGACSMLLPSACAATGGVTGAPGVACPAGPCSQLGACCNGAICQFIPAALCIESHTHISGAGSACNAPGNHTTPCCRADYNQSGSLAVQDIFDYLNDWFAGNPTTSFIANGLGAPTIQDVFDYLNAWFTGC
jgi:hypothetical protein